MRRARDEHGNVTLLVAAVIVVAILLGSALAHFGSVVVAKSRAANAADAGALAAAGRLALGHSPVDACAVAGRVVVDNGAQLLTCHCRGAAAAAMSVEITVAIGAVRAGSRARADAIRLSVGRSDIRPDLTVSARTQVPSHQAW